MLLIRPKGTLFWLLLFLNKKGAEYINVMRQRPIGQGPHVKVLFKIQ